VFSPFDLEFDDDHHLPRQPVRGRDQARLSRTFRLERHDPAGA
jgi:hypothetical protein